MKLTYADAHTNVHCTHSHTQHQKILCHSNPNAQPDLKQLPKKVAHFKNTESETN